MNKYQIVSVRKTLTLPGQRVVQVYGGRVRVDVLRVRGRGRAGVAVRRAGAAGGRRAGPRHRRGQRHGGQRAHDTRQRRGQQRTTLCKTLY